jgi:hypothetical protein
MFMFTNLSSPMSPLARIVLVWMVRLQNPNDPALAGVVTPEWAASYPETAEEIAEAAERDPIGGSARMTAALLTVTAFRESRFRDEPCTHKYTCDQGASIGKFQTWKGWGPPTADTALSLMHKSFEVCRDRPFADRLGWYLQGGSGCDRRLEMSRSRIIAAKSLSGTDENARK